MCEASRNRANASVEKKAAGAMRLPGGLKSAKGSAASSAFFNETGTEPPQIEKYAAILPTGGFLPFAGRGSV
jgi:hypothetical protein